MLNADGISWKDDFADLPTAGSSPCTREEPGQRSAGRRVLHRPRGWDAVPVQPGGPGVSRGLRGEPPGCAQQRLRRLPGDQRRDVEPAWPSTALILTFDEHGGYDDVPPVPAVRPDGIVPEVAAGDTYGDLYSWTGFRVPTVVVSPWGAPGLRLAHRLRPHVDPAVGRVEEEPARPLQPGCQRQRPAGLLRSAPTAADLAAAPAAPALVPSGACRLHRRRPRQPVAERVRGRALDATKGT